MKVSTPEETYQFDEFGHLVREENETDEDYAARTAQVLHQEGLSSNHPDDVAASNAPAIPEAVSEESSPNPTHINEEEAEEHDMEEVEEGNTTSSGHRSGRRGRRG